MSVGDHGVPLLPMEEHIEQAIAVQVRDLASTKAKLDTAETMHLNRCRALASMVASRLPSPRAGRCQVPDSRRRVKKPNRE